MERSSNVLAGLYKGTSSHWQWYRDFFHITIFKYLVTWFAIVPIAANLLNEVPKKIELVPDFILVLELPFKWECLWLSSFFFMLAYTLYILFCPAFIKKYFSLKQYLEYEHSPRWLPWEAKALVSDKSVVKKFIERMTAKGYVVTSTTKSPVPVVKVESKKTTLLFSFDNTNYEFSMPILNVSGEENESKTRIAVREIFWEIFGRFSSSKPVARAIIKIFLIIALILFLIPLIQSLVAVFEYFMR